MFAIISQTPLELAQNYLHHGISPLPLPHRSKAPIIAEWQKLRPTQETLPELFDNNPANIGALLGDASAGLTDIDLDWSEAAQLARLLLPKSWAFGRRDDNQKLLLRHVLIKCPGAGTVKFDAPTSVAGKGEPRRIVELLSTGTQVVLPGSRHPEGALIEWLFSPDETPLAELPEDALLQGVQNIAGCALLTRIWPELEGSRHDVVLALSGAMHHAGQPRTAIENTLVALLKTVDDSERKDRARAVQNTLDAAAAGQPVTGVPKLSELLPDDVLTCLVKWWHLGSAAVPLDFGSQAATAPVADDTAWADEWPELLEFESAGYQGQTRDYPVDALGTILGPAVQALTEQQQVPAALAAQSIIAAAACLAQQYYDVSIDNRHIPLSIWLALVAEPGERKTSTDSMAFTQLFRRQREAELQYQAALEGWKAAKTDKESEPGPRPRNPRWLLSDITTEGLLRTLNQHWPALTLTNSDAGTWLAGYSMREGRDSATASTLSQLWSGAAHTVVRASMDEPLSLDNRRLSLSLMLQPELAAALFENRTLTGQGFLSRCLPAFPSSTIGSRRYRPAQRDARLQQFFDAQDRLLTKQPPLDMMTGELKLAGLPLAGDAKQLWITIHDHYEGHLVNDYADIREVANKAPEQVLRLAGIMTVIEGGDSISVTHIENSARLVDFYLSEWQAMQLRLVSHRRDVALPMQLYDWMCGRRAETGQNVFALRDIYRTGPRIVRSQSQLARQLMTELSRRGYVRMDGKGYQLRPEGEL